MTINLNGVFYEEFEADATSAQIPAEKLAGLGSQVTISASFWWDGPPNDEQDGESIITSVAVVFSTALSTTTQPPPC